MNKRDKLFNKIIQLTELNVPNSEVYLFGSRARGDFHTHSDWDLLILINSNTIPFSLETDLLDQIYEVELETGEIISPLIYSKTDWERTRSFTPLFNTIKKEGIRIQ